MKKGLLILMVLTVYGCASSGALHENQLRHEEFEPRLLTEQEFMNRASQSATLIYEGMSTINEAAKQYALGNNGVLPTGTPENIRALLLEGGYLKSWPVVPHFAFTDPTQFEIKYQSGYADMDGRGAFDDTLFVQDLKLEVCNEFNRRYASAGLEDSIYNYGAKRERYPGEVFGRHMKIYAIKWPGEDYIGYCDIEWVMQYND